MLQLWFQFSMRFIQSQLVMKFFLKHLMEATDPYSPSSLVSKKVRCESFILSSMIQQCRHVFTAQRFSRFFGVDEFRVNAVGVLCGMFGLMFLG